ncbi:cytochrome c [Variovorax sp. dw_308]|uniref:c-type cytochrome n=1 Tax=Variovorax sp. dw_308 TaxID=2721546 RepID=UPI001C481746|nr:cytochrome c [Variovorax sp. dw_308]
MSVSTKKWLRRVGVVVLFLLALAAAAIWLGQQMADRKMQRKLDIPVQAVALRDDAAAVARGQYLFQSRGCADCHGANGGGRVFIDDPKTGMRVAGPHISPGPGSVTAGYQPVDWVRAIRHGVSPAGRALIVMPSEDYNRYTDDDLASLIAWLRSMPAAQGGAAVLDLPLPVRVMYGFGLIQDAAAKIDHKLPPPAPVAQGVSREHGAYVANMCLGCHGPTLAGGKVPGGPPDWPPAARLAPGEGSVMARYPDAASLTHLFRTGKRADGSEVKVMPFESLGKMSDTDLQALHLYLQSLQKS